MSDEKKIAVGIELFIENWQKTKSNLAEVTKDRKVKIGVEVNEAEIAATKRLNAEVAKETKAKEAATKATERESKAKERAALKEQKAKEREASAAEKAREKLDWFATGMRSFGQGGIRRGGAQMATGALMDAGINKDVASVLGAMSGGVLSSIMLPIGWAIGNAVIQAVSNLPQVYGNIQSAGLSDEMLAWKMGQRGDSGTAVDRERRATGAKAALYRVVHGTGLNAMESMSMMAKVASVSNLDVAFDKMTQFAAIAASTSAGEDRGATLKSLAEGYHHLKTSGRLADVGGYIRQNPLLNEAMRSEWKRMYGLTGANTDTTEKLYQEYLGSGLVSPRMLDTLIKNVAIKNVDALQKVQASGADKPWLSEESGPYYTEHAQDQIEYLRGRGIKHPRWKSYLGPNGEPGLPRTPGLALDTRYSYYGSESLPGLQGSATQLSKKDQRVMPDQYQWTSFAGLAEQMQMMWSGAPADAMGSAATKMDGAADKIAQAADRMLSGGEGTGWQGEAVSYVS